MDAITVVSTALAAVAALLSAVSALASWRSTRAVEEDVALSRATTRYELFRSFEAQYTQLYPSLWERLGPWKDPKPVDPGLRRTVHDLLQTLASIYNAGELGLIAGAQRTYLVDLFVDWLRLENAQVVWNDIFRHQEDTWPQGFVGWIDERLEAATSLRSM